MLIRYSKCDKCNNVFSSVTYVECCPKCQNPNIASRVESLTYVEVLFFRKDNGKFWDNYYVGIPAETPEELKHDKIAEQIIFDDESYVLIKTSEHNIFGYVVPHLFIPQKSEMI